MPLYERVIQKMGWKSVRNGLVAALQSPRENKVKDVGVNGSLDWTVVTLSFFQPEQTILEEGQGRLEQAAMLIGQWLPCHASSRKTLDLGELHPSWFALQND